MTHRTCGGDAAAVVSIERFVALSSRPQNRYTERNAWLFLAQRLVTMIYSMTYIQSIQSSGSSCNEDLCVDLIDAWHKPSLTHCLECSQRTLVWLRRNASCLLPGAHASVDEAPEEQSHKLVFVLLTDS